MKPSAVKGKMESKCVFMSFEDDKLQSDEDVLTGILSHNHPCHVVNYNVAACHLQRNIMIHRSFSASM